jgi:predicted dehydrogenase
MAEDQKTKQPSEKRVRYAVVGAGWISQAAFMPGVEHTGNSEVTTLVTGDPSKAQALRDKYGIHQIYDYAHYDDMLRSGEVDAVYLALPNLMHYEFAVRTLEAGIHLLLEKPMAANVEQCQAIIDASERSGAKLMVAYRLHFEAATLDAIELVRSGRIGEPRLFSSIFCQTVSGKNHRANPKYGAGPLQDMGPYPINAVRNLFGAEPFEVFAFETGALGATTTRELISVLLKFPEDRLAQFTVGYGENAVDQYRIVGTKGDLEMNPGFMMDAELKYRLKIRDASEERTFPKSDQFGAEIKYFSNCIQKNIEPEPDGEEGLADVRVINAIELSLKSGLAQKIEAMERSKRPGLAQVVKLPPVERQRMVNAGEPGEG